MSKSFRKKLTFVRTYHERDLFGWRWRAGAWWAAGVVRSAPAACRVVVVQWYVILEIMSGFMLCVVHTYGIFRIFGDWSLEFYLESDLYILRR